jgi:hypothetical protein
MPHGTHCEIPTSHRRVVSKGEHAMTKSVGKAVSFHPYSSPQSGCLALQSTATAGCSGGAAERSSQRYAIHALGSDETQGRYILGGVDLGFT